MFSTHDDTSNSRVETHRPLVEHIARDTFRHAPEHVRLDDLVSAGMVVLAAAAAAYDDSQKTSFGRYAAIRIRSAIVSVLLDHSQSDHVGGAELRSVEPAGRRFADDAIAALHEPLRTVVRGCFIERSTMPEIAAELGITTFQVSELRSTALGILRRVFPAEPRVVSGNAGTDDDNRRLQGAWHLAALSSRSSLRAATAHRPTACAQDDPATDAWTPDAFDVRG